MSKLGRSRFRKREVVLALAAGAVAATGGAIALEVMRAENTEHTVAAAESGPGELTYDLADFQEINVMGPEDVVITLGDDFAVRSEGSAEALRLLRVTVEDGKLLIAPREGFDWDQWDRLEPATFFITLPRLDVLAMAGSGDVAIDRIRGESFSGTLAGSGTLAIDSLEVDDLDLSIAGSGDIVASGQVREITASIGGSGTIDGQALRSQTAAVRIGGSGDTALWVADRADISIMGSGDVDITGTDKCSVSKVGSGEVRCLAGEPDAG